jgi:hypothetical protein
MVFLFCTFRTQMTQLRSRTKVVCPRRTSLLKDLLCHRTPGLEVPNGSTLDKTQTLLPKARVYDGRPML